MTDDNKLKIGKLIGYYRRYYDSKTRSNKWGQEKFVSFEGEIICSVKALSRIENGQETVKDEVYELLLKKLDMKFIENPELDVEIMKFIDEFYEAIKFYDRERADHVISRIRSYPEAQYAYYKQIVLSMEFVVNFEFDDIFCKDMDYYLLLAKCVDSKQLAFLTAYSVFNMNNDSLADVDILEKSNKIIIENKLSDVLSMQFKALANQINEEYLTAYDILEECIDICIKTGNIIRQLVLSLRHAYIETLIDIRHAVSLIVKFEELIEITKDKVFESKRLTIDNNHILSVLYYLNRDYQKTINCIMVAFEKDSRSICKVSPYFFSSMEKLNFRIEDLGVERIYLENSDKHYYLFYRYFILKHVEKVSDRELMNYLMKRVVQALLIGTFGKITYYIFEKEMERLVEKTRCYKLLVDFHILLFDFL